MANRNPQSRQDGPDPCQRMGYQPVRPDNVADIPPEQLPSPSAESPIAGPQPPAATDSGNGAPDPS